MRRRIVLLTVVGPALALFMAWKMVFNGPQVEAMADAVRREEAAVQTASMSNVAIRATEEYLAQGDAAQAEMERLLAAVPDTPALQEFLAAHVEAAAAAGVEIASVSPDTLLQSVTTPAPAGLQAVGLSLGVRGENSRVLDYLGRLESLGRITLVDDITLTRESDIQTSAMVRVRIFMTPQTDLEAEE